MGRKQESSHQVNLITAKQELGQFQLIPRGLNPCRSGHGAQELRDRTLPAGRINGHRGDGLHMGQAPTVAAIT